ncbi:multiple epidermal growth factor-like domains protein 10 isoform X2 [Ostrea edulis]|uniref:multiple epidermal growth factor-like domains protein 10 isoform X2 n=1 Tax=Ostrea edulis TaxID=37623 RepID=UPI0024AEC0A4|nr:multiple epidermal growth factor-like domains protein 10 isoform X2 [Ostrea edulis]
MLQTCLILLALRLSTAYENIAFNKPAWQGSQYNSGNDIFDASNAVDGLKSNLSAWGGQCVQSNVNQQTATWRVDLEDILSIHHISIYYRTENAVWGSTNGLSGRFLGFSLYVSNATDRTNGKLCLHDTDYTRDTIPAVLNVTCPVHGQYVIYYNERLQGVTYPTGYSDYAFNELCEVEVYGCPVPGYYGSDCSTPCYDTCRYCHIETGACQGCKPGYQGHQCELPCSPHYYGEVCNETCGNCSDGITCNNIDGTCSSGCDVGVYGDKCKTSCPIDLHGKNCSLPCGSCDTCDRFTGQCTSPCYPGWKGQHCTDECDQRRYGLGCLYECGACLEYTQCHHINGSCLQGCYFGFQGELCKTACPVGFYGTNCLERCSRNCVVPERCNKTSGECEGGCQPGWIGILCDTKCVDNQYGQDCNQTCGKCREAKQCHHVSGSCNDGCEPGYQGNKCDEVDTQQQGTECDRNCETRFYGVLCAFCVIVVLNGVYGLYKIMKWKKKKRSDKNKKYRASDSTISTKDTVLQVRKDENVNSAYQELGELSPSSTYDTIR